MHLNRQLINLLGIVLVAAVLAAGILLGAMPLFLDSRATEKQADDIAQTNQVYEVQVLALRADAERIDQIEADLTALRAQIPAAPRLDDVFALVNRAAAAAGVTIQTAAAAESEPWTVRTAPGADETQQPPPAPDATADAPDAGAPAENAQASPDAAGAQDADPAATPPASAPASPEVQVPITLIVVADDTASAAGFAEALGSGPRLLGITHATMTDASEGYTLTLDALAFVRTEQ